LPIKSGHGVKLQKRTDVTIQPYSGNIKPSFYYLLKSAGEFDENTLRSFLNTEGVKRKVKAEIEPVKNRNNIFKREYVSYAEILANLRTMAEWKSTQNKLKNGEIRNVQLAKLQMEEKIRKERLELARQFGTPKDYERELEAYRKFETFKANFLKGKEVEK